MLTGGLGANCTLFDFGQVASGSGKTLTLTLTNADNSDVNITDIALDGAAFMHNATNTRVPRGTSLSVTVTFTAGSVAGTQTGTLTFSSDGNPSSLAIVDRRRIAQHAAAVDTPEWRGRRWRVRSVVDSVTRGCYVVAAWAREKKRTPFRIGRRVV